MPYEDSVWNRPCGSLAHAACTVAFALLTLGAGCDPADAEDVAMDEQPERRPVGKGDSTAQQVGGTCVGHGGLKLCGDQGKGGCWCDDLCEEYGDCCDDFAPVCAPEPEPEPDCNPQSLEVWDLLISDDTVWDQCEVHLMRQKTIVDGDLTIMPGVHVFGDNAATPSSLLLRGNLLAHGTEDQPIVFQPGEGRSSWGGLATGAYTGEVSLQYVQMHKPTIGLHVVGGTVTATHVVFEGTTVGSGVSMAPSRPDTKVTLDDVLIRDFETGVSGWRIGHLHGARSELVVRNAVITDNDRGIFLGTDYDYCGNPEVAKPRGYVTVEHCDLVDNGLAFGVGYDERWTRYRIERSNLAGNDAIALIQPYEVPVGSSVRDSNIVDNDGGLVTYRKLAGTTSFANNHWGALDLDALLSRASSECLAGPVENLFSFGELRADRVADAGPQHPEAWSLVCESAIGGC